MRARLGEIVAALANMVQAALASLAEAVDEPP
jgi:hypothetical protein